MSISHHVTKQLATGALPTPTPRGGRRSRAEGQAGADAPAHAAASATNPSRLPGRRTREPDLLSASSCEQPTAYRNHEERT
jgi:hypothetical protein